MHWPLVAMENALFADRTLGWNERCALVATAGFAGIYAVPYPLTDADFSRVRDLAREPGRHGLFVEAIYLNVDLAYPMDAVPNTRITRVFEEINGTPRIELSFKHSRTDEPLTNLEPEIEARLEPLLEIADRRDLQVALYPHSFYPLETLPQAERIVRRINHPRLSFVFATSHVYAISSAAETVDQLARFAVQIASFNVCGCTRGGPRPPAKCVHHPLDQGELPLRPLFQVLAEKNYSGPVIVQGHGWTGDLPAQLRRCVSATTDLFPQPTSLPVQRFHL